MDYQEKKKQEMAVAMQTVESLNNSKDKYVTHRDSRPITDIKQMLESSTELFGDKVAFKQRFVKDEPFGEVSYRQAYDDVNGLGTCLMEAGFNDRRIAVIGDNCYQWAVSYLAAVCGIGVVVPLDKELGADELKRMVIEAEVSVVFFSKKLQDMFIEMKNSGDTKLELLVNMDIKEADGEIGSWYEMKEKGKELIAAEDRRFLDAEIDANAMSILIFTSGTTGTAKGVMLSQRNICEDLMVAPTLMTTGPEDTFFSVLPLNHTYECTCGFLMPLYKGAAIAYCEGLKYIVKNLAEVKPTMMLAVPLIYEMMYKNIMKAIRKQGKERQVKMVMSLNKVTKKIGIDLNHRFLKDIYAVFGGQMRAMVSGGSAIDPAILQFLNDLGIIAVQGYGLTECGPMAALNPDHFKDMRNDSVGHLLPGMEVKIVNKDEDGIGEICLKGPNVMLGYYNMPEATAEALRDGWFYTGDQGYVDEDNFIYITGRKKNVIIAANGKNVFPEELEYYLGLIPYVEESMVWSEKEEGSSNDTLITATIKPDMEEVEAAIGEEKAKDPAEIEKLLWTEVDKLNEKQPRYKMIRRIVVREKDFDKTSGRKIKRFVESNKEE